MGKTKLESGMGPTPILAAYPVVMVGSMVDGKADFATVAWTGVAASVPPTISVALQHHRYSLRGIRQNMAFSVNIPSVDLVKETDFCGLVSGARVDKVKRCNFKVFFGKQDQAPLIEACPVVHACEVVQIVNLGSHELIIGRIVETYVSDDCMTDGRPDPGKMHPLIYSGRGYSAVGPSLGAAFDVGKAISPEDRMDTLEEIERMRTAVSPPKPRSQG
jgi:flavin reductase (DIM6/NTAB) family NADH-FMN oxidoreductase RutF